MSELKFLKRKLERYGYLIDMLTKTIIKREGEVAEVRSELAVSNARIVDLQKELDSSVVHQKSEESVVDSATNFSEADKEISVLDLVRPHLAEIMKIFNHNDFHIDDNISVDWKNQHRGTALDVTISFRMLEAEKVGKPIKEKMVESDVAFSSRFMPDVKFCIMGKHDLFRKINLPIMGNYIRTAFDGSIVDLCDYKGNYDKWADSKEVSIYEAIPELVPKDMVYDKESDSLVGVSILYDTPKDWAKKNVSPNMDKKTFDSRFMPNVKFIAPEYTNEPDDVCHRFNYNHTTRPFYYGYCVVDDGHLSGFKSAEDYKECSFKEVSIYKACPEFLPKGMVLDKAKGELVQKVCVNPMCGGEACDCDDSHSFPTDEEFEKFAELLSKSITTKTFAGELARTYSLSIDTCLSVIEDYGEENASAACGLVKIGADPSGLKLKTKEGTPEAMPLSKQQCVNEIALLVSRLKKVYGCTVYASEVSLDAMTIDIQLR